MSGVWRVTYSMESFVESGDDNIAYLYLNGDQMNESYHQTYSESGTVISTSGRVVTMEANEGDNIELRTTSMDDTYYYIIYCADYVPKM